MNYLTAETLQIFKNIPLIINKTFPIPARFRKRLPSDIAELSRLLTNRRGDRSLSYLGRPNFLSAYLHYFLPWNIYRLCILLQNTDLSLAAGDVINDLGSGPLTFPCALWIARPDLRSIPLEINCIDRCSPALEAGKNFFAALCAAADNNEINWKINLLREDIDIRKNNRHKRKPASLVCAVNLFNEMYEKLPHNDTEGLKHIAANAAAFMNSLALKDASILTVEPGVPQSGRFISFLRTSFMETGRLPVSPCTHAEVCPFSGKTTKGKKRWCHFAFKTDEAPKELHRLASAAGIPKDRLVFSYLLMGSEKTQTKQSMRIISDAFPLPLGRIGCYGCGANGLILLTGGKSHIEKAGSLSLITDFINTNELDEKSGAMIVRLPDKQRLNNRVKK